MIRLILLFVSLMLLMINLGCSPVGVLAGGSSATMVVAEGDRSLGTVVDDATIKLNLSGKFLQSENKFTDWFSVSEVLNLKMLAPK